MNLNLIHKLLFGIFFLFLLFSAIVFLVGDYMINPLFSIVVFVAILYIVYYVAIKVFMKDL